LDLVIESIIIVYLDNILIFTWILKEYYKIVYRVLEVLAKHKLYIEYLDLVISENQVEIDFIKATGVHN